MTERFTNLGFIGAGTLGTALAERLQTLGERVVAVASRTEDSASRLALRVPGCEIAAGPQQVVEASDLTFLTVPDDAIEQVASSLSWRRGKAVVHCSGAKGAEVLEHARAQGALVGAFHALQTFASVEQALHSLQGSAFALDGDPDLVEHLRYLARGLGGMPIDVPADGRVLYHASAVMVCGYLVALADRAAGLWETFGMDRETALPALLPLMEGTLESLRTNGVPQALTGPLARGDVGTVSTHVRRLEERAPEALSLYARLGLEALRLANAKGGLNEAARAELEALLRTHALPGVGTTM